MSRLLSNLICTLFWLVSNNRRRFLRPLCLPYKSRIQFSLRSIVLLTKIFKLLCKAWILNHLSQLRILLHIFCFWLCCRSFNLCFFFMNSFFLWLNFSFSISSAQFFLFNNWLLMKSFFVFLTYDFFSYFLYLKGFDWPFSIECSECGSVWTTLKIINESTLTYLFIDLVSLSLVKSAKHRSWHIVLRVSKIFLHFVPCFYKTTSDSASNMIAAATAFKITLNAAALVFMTS